MSYNYESCIICYVKCLGEVNADDTDKSICSKCLFKDITNRMKLIRILDNLESNSGWCEYCCDNSRIFNLRICDEH